MFEKLIQEMRTNPGSVGKFIRYSKRLNSQYHARLFGVLIIIVALLSHYALLINTPNNNTDGKYTIQKIKSEWQKQTDLYDIYTKYGVNIDDINRIDFSNTEIIESKSINNFWMTDLSSIKSSNDSKQIAIRSNSTNFYMRPLSEWNMGGHKRYEVLKGQNSLTGKDFWIDTESGNYIQIGRTIGNDIPKQPVIEARNFLISDTSELNKVRKLSLITEFRNLSTDSLAQDVEISIAYNPADFEAKTINSDSTASDGSIKMYPGNIPYSDVFSYQKVDLVLKNELGSTVDACIDIEISSSNSKITKPHNKERLCALENIKQLTTTDTRTLDENLEPSKNLSVKNDDYGNITFELGNFNSAKQSVKYTPSVYIGDVLDYFDVDINTLYSKGVIYNDQDKRLTWQEQVIQPRSEQIFVVATTKKQEIPTSARPFKSSHAFDCNISMIYGNIYNQEINCPLVKKYENLAYTDKKSSLLIFSAILVISILFLARTKILSLESDKIKLKYQNRV